MPTNNVKVGFHMTGVDEAVTSMRAKMAAANLAARKIVADGGEMIAEEARAQFIPRVKGGRHKVTVYHKDGTTSEAWAYGAPVDRVNHRPTQRTGNLQRSIQVFTSRGPRQGMWISETGPTAKYGRRVELGMHYGEGDDTYPYMQPGFTRAKPKVQALATKEWRLALSYG